MRSLSFKDQEIAILPEINLAQCAGLEELDVSNNLLGTRSFGKLVKEQILNFIKKIPSLCYIDISNNPLPPEIVYQLHMEIHDLNKKTRLEKPIILISDYSQSTNNKSTDPLSFDPLHILSWVFSEWQNTENPTLEMNAISQYIKPSESLAINVKNNLHRPNKRGVTLLLSAAQSANHNLCQFIISYISPYHFAKNLIEHSKSMLDTSRPQKPPELYIPHLISACFTRYPSLVKNLVEFFLNKDSMVALEILGNNAIKEEKFDDAFEYYARALAKGSIDSHLLIVALVLENKLSRYSLTKDEMKSHLIISSDSGNLNAKFALAKLYEEEKNMVASMEMIENINLILIAQPHRKKEIYKEYYQQLEFANEFIESFLVNFPESLFHKRAELASQRCPESLRKHFNIIHLHEQLRNTLGPALKDTLKENVAYSVLQVYLKDKMVILNIQHDLLEKMDTVQSGDLFSMNPTRFAHAVKEAVLNFQSRSVPTQRCLKTARG